MHYLLLVRHREEMLLDAVTISESPHVIAGRYVIMHKLCGGKRTHAARPESLQQRAVLEFTDDSWVDCVVL